MDMFLVINETAGTVECRFISEAAAVDWVDKQVAAEAKRGSTYSYQVAQVVTTNRPVRVWNTP